MTTTRVLTMRFACGALTPTEARLFALSCNSSFSQSAAVRSVGSPFQHPNGNDTPGVGMFPPIGLPDPSAGAIPVTIPPGPGHAVIEGLGTGTPISPPSPAPLRSVAPIGMFAPPREVAAEDVTAPDPGTDDSPDSTGKPSATVPQPTISPVLMSGELVPPPSNMLLGLAGLGLNGTTADPVRTGQSMGPD
jgi:hypothetical protein